MTGAGVAAERQKGQKGHGAVEGGMQGKQIHWKVQESSWRGGVNGACSDMPSIRGMRMLLLSTPLAGKLGHSSTPGPNRDRSHPG